MIGIHCITAASSEYSSFEVCIGGIGRARYWGRTKGQQAIWKLQAEATLAILMGKVEVLLVYVLVKPSLRITLLISVYRDRSGHVASCPSDSARVPSHGRIMHKLRSSTSQNQL